MTDYREFGIVTDRVTQIRELGDYGNNLDGWRAEGAFENTQGKTFIVWSRDTENEVARLQNEVYTLQAQFRELQAELRASEKANLDLTKLVAKQRDLQPCGDAGANDVD